MVGKEEMKKAFEWIRGGVVRLISTILLLILLLWFAVSFMVCVADWECRAHLLGHFIDEGIGEWMREMRKKIEPFLPRPWPPEPEPPEPIEPLLPEPVL